MKNLREGAILVMLLILAAQSIEARLQSCKASGKIRGENLPPGQCNQENNSHCCKVGKLYTTYKCSSPPVSGSTKAVLTINSFEMKAALRNVTGWYSGGRRCLKNVVVSGNGRSVTAMVVDECDEDHDYQRPCPNNIVDASRAV